jgi:hypothetical protein
MAAHQMKPRLRKRYKSLGIVKQHVYSIMQATQIPWPQAHKVLMTNVKEKFAWNLASLLYNAVVPVFSLTKSRTRKRQYKKHQLLRSSVSATSIFISSSHELDTDSETDSTAQGASQPPPSNQQLMSMSGRPPRRRCRDTITYVDGPDFRSEENDSYQPDTVRFPSGTLEPDETPQPALQDASVQTTTPQAREYEEFLSRRLGLLATACPFFPRGWLEITVDNITI